MGTEARYQVVGKIGEGGMGAVYRAVDRVLHRSVALKLFPQSVWPEGQLRARLLREARVAAALNHPNVCTIYEVGECREDDPIAPAGEEKTFAPGTPFLAMELVEGVPLSAKLEAGPLPFEEVLALAVPIAEGLAEAHRHNIVHRDLKPQNVMVTPQGRVKILDFGLAKPLVPMGEGLGSAVETISRELTREGLVAGTIAYMAPEQAMGKPVDARSDVFSFGAMLYEMATGKRPFEGETPTATLAKILEGEPPPIEALRPDLPHAFGALVARCLRKRPEERYQNGAEVGAALEAMRQAAVTTTRPVRLRLRLWTRRVGWRAAAAAGLALALLLGARAVLRSDLLAPPPPPPVYTKVTVTGDVTFAALSRDGRFMATLKGLVGGSDPTPVFVQELGESRTLQVFEGKEVWDISWSPDGSRLLVAATVGDVPGAYLVPRLGGTFRRFEGGCDAVAWSPDGTRFAARTGRTSIRVTDVATGASRTLSFEESFPEPPTGPRPGIGMDWSPAGDWLVLGDYDGDRVVLWTLSVEEGKPVRLVEDTVQLSSPRWAPAGDAVYYLRPSGSSSDLWKISVDARTGRARGEPRLVLSGLDADWFSVSADGKHLLCLRGSGRSNLSLVRLEPERPGGASMQPITTGTVFDDDPTVSPDGTRVAFVRHGAEEESHVLVVPIEGGTPLRLTHARPHNEEPAWSPDGKEIAFATLVGEEHRIAVVPASGGAERVFSRTRVRDSPRTAWAPGRRIVYTAADGKLRLLDPETEEEVSFPEGEVEVEGKRGMFSSVSSSPDGERLGLRMYLPEPNLGVLAVGSLEGGPLRAVDDEGGLLAGWRADGRYLYLLDETDEGAMALFLVPAEGGERRILAILPSTVGEPVQCVSTRDEATFVCAFESRESDAWLVENFDPEIR